VILSRFLLAIVIRSGYSGVTGATLLEDGKMYSEDDLRSRIEELEHKTSHPWLLLFVVAGVLGACLIQLRINAYFKGQINAMRGIETQAVSHE
jgi:hypothetical protein